MPVGQAVTATSDGLVLVSVGDAVATPAGAAAGAPVPGACVGVVVSPPPGGAAPDGAPEAGAAAAAGAGSPSSWVTTSTTSSTDSADRRASVKAGLTRARASLVRMVRWSAS